jgi:V/A-type H+-transporting ATPase subunit F
MRYFVIADEMDTLVGLRLAGIEGVVATTASEVEAQIKAAAADSNIAILLVTEPCAALCPDLIRELRLSAERPLVAVIPGISGSSREPDSITRLVREAIGIRI